MLLTYYLNTVLTFRRRLWYISSRIRKGGTAPPNFRYFTPSTVLKQSLSEPVPSSPVNIYFSGGAIAADALPVAMTSTEIDIDSHDGKCDAETRAAVKLQALARRFSVQRHLPFIANGTGELSTKCNQALSPRPGVVAVVTPEDKEFFPGYYNNQDRYLYYQADESGDYFGYYDDDGVYLYCEGDKNKVKFSPQEIATQSDLLASTAVVGENVLLEEVSNKSDKLVLSVPTDDNNKGNGCTDSLDYLSLHQSDDQLVIVSDPILPPCGENEKSVKFLDEVNVLANTAPQKKKIVLDGFEVDDIVNDIDNYSGESAIYFI